VRVLQPRLRGLRGEPGFISAEGLAWEVGRRLGRRVSTSYIQQIEWGKTPPSSEVLEAIAAHFGIPPEAFAEYRLARARDLLDDYVVGLAAAVANYELLAREVPALRAATDRIADVDEDAVEKALAQLREAEKRVLEAAGPSATAAAHAPPPAGHQQRHRRARRPH
jgi:transcriptional regulator with XRE-family HTH domain